MAVNVVDAGLRIVFLDEDRRVLSDRAVADRIDEASESQVIVGLHGDRVGRATGVIGADPHEFQPGHSAGRYVMIEVLLPDVEAILIGNAQVELWVVLDCVLVQVRERGVGADLVEVLELGFFAASYSNESL